MNFPVLLAAFLIVASAFTTQAQTVPNKAQGQAQLQKLKTARLSLEKQVAEITKKFKDDQSLLELNDRAGKLSSDEYTRQRVAIENVRNAKIKPLQKHLAQLELSELNVRKQYHLDAEPKRTKTARK